MAAVSAVASAVIAGASLTGTSIEKIALSIGTDRNVTISICNYSQRYILRNPRVYTTGGYTRDPPQPTIRINTTEVCSFTKNPGIMYGCAGVLTYDLAEDDDCDPISCIAIMFSVPYDYATYTNWFGLGIFDANQTCDESLFNLMYYNSGLFDRDNCSGREVKFQKSRVEVKGTMCPRAKAIAKIELWDY